MENNPFNEISERLSRIEQELVRQGSNKVSSERLNSESHFLTVTQAAEFLNLATQSIYGLIHRKKIPCMKRGKRVYFSKTSLIAWVESGRKPTQDEFVAESRAILVKRGGSK
jgi:excisionase family DNA binding protein